MEISNEFNAFYTKIGKTLDQKLPQPYKNPLSYLKGNYPLSMIIPDIGIDETIKVIKSLKDKNDKLIQPFSLKKMHITLLVLSQKSSIFQSIVELFLTNLNTQQ